MVRSVFDATAADIEDAVHSGRAILSDHDDEPASGDGEPVVLSKGLARLTHAQAVEFRRQVRALYEAFGELGDRTAAGDRTASGDGGANADVAAATERHPFGVVLAFYPMADPPTKTGRRPRQASRAGTARPRADAR